MGESIQELQFYEDKPYIKKIHFPQNDTSLLKNCDDIDNISEKLMIITGLNGSGKSLLLNFIHGKLIELKKSKFAFIKADKEGFTTGINCVSVQDLKNMVPSIRENSETISNQILADLKEDIKKNLPENIDYNDNSEFDEFFSKLTMNINLISNFEHSSTILKFYEINSKIETDKNSSKIIENINEILEKINYPYSYDNDFKLYDNKNKTSKIAIKNLSSGETIILSLAIWYANIENLKNSKDFRKYLKTDILLFDEVDKHLDPIQCKHFVKLINMFCDELQVQVIMSTHRFDTVALSPSESLYLVSKAVSSETSIVKFEKKEKLEILKELTENLIALTNLHSRVYVEGKGDDMKFYSIIYEALKRNRENIIKSVSNEKIVFINQELKSRISECVPSNKHELLFYSAHDKNQVIGSVERDQTAFDNLNDALANQDKKSENSTVKNEKLSINLLTALNSFRSFGIVDQDHEKKPKIDKNAENYLLTLPRYCLENFLVDPFIFIGFDNIKLSDDQNIKDLINSFKETCDKIRKNINDGITKNKEVLQKNLNDYFETILEILETKLKNKKPKTQKEESKINKKETKKDDENSKVDYFDGERNRINKHLAEIIQPNNANGKENRLKDIDDITDDDLNQLKKLLKDMSLYKKNKNIKNLIENKENSEKIEIQVLTENSTDGFQTVGFKYPKCFIEISGKEVLLAFGLNTKELIKKFNPKHIPMDIVEIILDLFYKIQTKSDEKKSDEKKSNEQN